MATIDELLASETGAVLTVDLASRTINVPPNIKNIGVESDDDVVVLPFSIPRYFGDMDLSAFSIRINYLNAKSEGDVYLVTTADIGPEEIKFEWKVGRYATAYKGNVTFNICLKKMGSGGTVVQELNTTVCSLPVLQGLETDEAVIQEYPDIFTQLVNEALYAAKASGEFDGKDGEDYVLTEEDKVEMLDSLKSYIVNDSDRDLIYSFASMNNREMRSTNNATETLTIDIPDGEYPEQYISGLVFTSGSTATTVIYTQDIHTIQWVGTDCSTSVDNDQSIFRPMPNKNYDIVFYFNGKHFIGLVNGYDYVTLN